MGAAYGTAKAGVGISAAGVLRPDLVVQSPSPSFPIAPIPTLLTRQTRPSHNLTELTSLLDITPIVMAAILAIYGLVVSVMIANTLTFPTHIFSAFIHLGAGLAVGISALGAGFAIGITGDAGVRGCSMQPKLFVGMMLILIFSEVLGEFRGFPICGG